MIPVKHRVTNIHFTDVLKKGRRIDGVFVYMKYKMAQGSRFSAVVPTSVEKKAVKRNSIRRKIREAVKPYITKTKVYGIVFAKKEIKNASFSDIQRDIDGIFKKI